MIRIQADNPGPAPPQRARDSIRLVTEPMRGFQDTPPCFCRDTVTRIAAQDTGNSRLGKIQFASNGFCGDGHIRLLLRIRMRKNSIPKIA